MSSATCLAREPRSCRWLQVLGLLLLGLWLGPVPCSAAAPAPPPVSVSPVLADGWTLSKLSGKFYAPFEWAFGNKRRMIQLSTVCMCLALFIIWWRRT